MADAGQEMICQTLLPEKAAVQLRATTPKPSEPVWWVESSIAGKNVRLRFTHLLQLRRAGDETAAAKWLVDEDGHLRLSFAAGDRTILLTLPPPDIDPGHIEIQGSDGKTIVPCRPLPAGVLPHGPEGVRLLERWDGYYRDGRTPPWETGRTANELKRIVEEGIVRPCRALELGCGSGTNAVYLASKGFEVTAIDVAPTALAIAEQNAKKADVRVRWLLADVLAPPDLATFDFIFDRGCYHNVRYVNAAGFVESVRRLSRPGTQMLILSLNRDGPPGVRERHMREDFSSQFEIEWLKEAGIELGKDGKNRPQSWSAMLRRKRAE